MSTQPPNLLSVPLLHRDPAASPPPPPPPATSGSNVVHLSHHHHDPSPPPPPPPPPSATSVSDVVRLSHEHHDPSPPQPPPPATSTTNVVRLSHHKRVPAPPSRATSTTNAVRLLADYTPTPPPSGTPNYEQIIGVILSVGVFFALILIILDKGEAAYPLFKIESVSISTGPVYRNAQVAAQWNVGFSVADEPASGSIYSIAHIEEYDISVRFLGRDWAGKVVQGTFFDNRRNRVWLNATVDTLVPIHEMNQGLTFDAKLRVGYSGYQLDATCTNITMGFTISQDVVNWSKQGDQPVLCHVDH